MTNTEALIEILGRVGEFTGMPLAHIQIPNNPIVDGKPFEPPKDQIWAKVFISNAGSHIKEIGSKPNKRTVGIIYIQLFGPMNSGTFDLSTLADLWAEHLEYYQVDGLELREASIIDVGESNGLYQYNVNIPYQIN